MNPYSPQQQQQQQLQAQVLMKAKMLAQNYGAWQHDKEIPRDQIKEIVSILSYMKRNGLQQDPSYVLLYRIMSAQAKFHTRPPTSFTPHQRVVLKAQIHAFKQHILKKQPIPLSLAEAIRGNNVEHNLREYEQTYGLQVKMQQQQQQQQQQEAAPSYQHPISQMQATPASFQQQQAAFPAPPSTAAIVREAYRTQAPDFASVGRTPGGLDFHTLLHERDRRVWNLVIQRAQELKQVLHNKELPQLERAKAAFEIKQLMLLKFQRQLRSEVVGEMYNLSDKSRKQSEAQLQQKQLQQQKLKQEGTSSRGNEQHRHKKFLNEVTVLHRRKFQEWHKNQQKNMEKMNKDIIHFYEKRAKMEKEKKEKQERARLKALKDHDEEAYLKLLKEAKVDRLTELIKQTDDCLRQLGAQLISGRDSAADGEEILMKDQLEKGEGEEEDPSFLDETEKMRDRDIYTNFLKNQKAYYKIAHTYKENVDKQPSILKGELKPYQLQGLQWLVSLYNNKLNGILADEMGLGKTIQTISLLSYLYEFKNNKGPHLVIMPLSTLENWSLEFEKWSPELKVVKYIGKPQDRKLIQQSALKDKGLNVLLCQYEYVSRDKKALKKINWNYIIIDEGHRIKNASSKLVADLANYKSKHRLLLTGTPLQNDLKELWSLFHFLLPNIFNSVLNFESWFSTPFQSISSEKISITEEETLLIISRLHQVLRPFLLRREKSEVEAQLPEKVEKLIRCELSAMQQRFYRQIQNENRLLIQDEKRSKTKSLNNSVMQLRKACNHPFLFFDDWSSFNPIDVFRTSGKFDILDRILPKLKASGHRVLLFSQMTQLLNILEEYLKMRRYMYLRLDGNVKAEDRGGLVKAFNAPNSPHFVFLLSTRAGGLGLNLQAADTVIIFDSDWNPQQDLQAQARAHRIGQTRSVRVFTLITNTDVEERIYRRAQEKKDAEQKVIGAGKFNQKSTYRERQEMLQVLIRKEDDFKKWEIPNYDQLNHILARNENEYQLFHKIDQEMTIQWNEYWKQLGKDPAPPRLMTEEELPPWIFKEEDLALMEKSEELRGRGMRSRKKVAYDETGMLDEDLGPESEDDDRQEEDEGVDDEEDEELKAFIVEDEEDGIDNYDDDNDDDNEDSATRQSSRKRKRKHDNDDNGSGDGDDEIQAEGSDESSTVDRKRKKTKQPFASKMKSQGKRQKQQISATLPLAVKDEIDFEQVEQQLPTPLQHVLWGILKTMVTATSDTDSRPIAEIFITLPDKRMYSDYYQMIAQPIAFEQLEMKIRNNEYTSIEAMENDVTLLCKNAQTYNLETSQVYQDSEQLMNIFQFEKQKLSRKTPMSSAVSMLLQPDINPSGSDMFEEGDYLSSL